MIKRCEKCNTEMDTDRDFCIVCGNFYKKIDNSNEENIEEQKKIEEVEIKQVVETNPTEEEKSNPLSFIFYLLAFMVISPFIYAFLLITSVGGSFSFPRDWLFFLAPALGIFFLVGIIISTIKENRKK